MLLWNGVEGGEEIALHGANTLLFLPKNIFPIFFFGIELQGQL